MSLNCNLLTKTEFALISCLNSAIYGVKNSCDDCVPWNYCVQKQLENLIPAAIETVENRLKYNLSPRYHREEIQWNGGYEKIALKWKGVSAVNVKEEVTTIEDFGPFAISPYIIQNVPLQDGGSYCIAVVDGTLVENPERITFWRNGVQYPTQDVPGYPQINGDGDWLIPLGKEGTPACLGYDIHVHHCDYMILDVELLDGECEDGEVLPVYPGTEEPITLYKTESIGGGLTRYWFYTWSLVNRAFKQGVVDLSAGHFYKLYQTIEFACFTEVEQKPILLEYELPCNCCDPVVFTTDDQTDNTAQTLKLSIQVLFSENSVIYVQPLNECPCDFQHPIKFFLYYKTDPDNISDVCGSIEVAKQAIVWWVGSEIDLDLCGCAEIPFITAAHSPVDDLLMNPLTGTETQKQSYEKAYGKVKAKSLLAKTKKKQRRVVI